MGPRETVLETRTDLESPNGARDGEEWIGQGGEQRANAADTCQARQSGTLEEAGLDTPHRAPFYVPSPAKAQKARPTGTGHQPRTAASLRGPPRTLLVLGDFLLKRRTPLSPSS